MRDFERPTAVVRGSRRREQEARGAPICVDAGPQRRLGPLPSGHKFGPIDASRRVVRSVAQRDQPQEELPRSRLPGSVELEKQLLRTTGQRAGDAADRLVHWPRAGAALRRLSKSSVSAYCSRRQRPRLVEYVGDDLGEQALLERDAG